MCPLSVVDFVLERHCVATAREWGHRESVTLDLDVDAVGEWAHDREDERVAVGIGVVDEHGHDGLAVAASSDRVGGDDRRPVLVTGARHVDGDLDGFADRSERVDRAVGEPRDALEPVERGVLERREARRSFGLVHVADVGLGRERVESQPVTFGVDVVEEHVDDDRDAGAGLALRRVLRRAPGWCRRSATGR